MLKVHTKIIINALFALFVCFSSATIASEPSNTPQDAIVLTTPQGEQLLDYSQHKASHLKLMRFFTTQKNTRFCGIASSVMALNALDVVPAPISVEQAPAGNN